MKSVKYWLSVLLWAGLIFYLSSIPSLNSGLGLGDLILRKAFHSAEFFILAWLLFRAVRESFSISQFDASSWAAILSFIYAVSDEYHQLFVPGREGAFRDILFDCLGIAAFFVFLKFQEGWRREK